MARAALATDPWHYSRPELAAKYLEVIAVGLTSARALFAKRRMGKSEFLEQDLMPAARKRGYITVYLNLWDARSQPKPALLAALTRALEPIGLGKLAKTLKRPLKNVKASAKIAGVAEGSLQAELQGSEADVTPRITELIRGFDKPTRRMLLILDEAQVLAEPAHSDLALADTQSHVFNDANFVNLWNGLLPADRELLRLIVAGITDVFSESSRQRLGTALGMDEAVTKNVPQKSLRRLQDMDLMLRMDYGDYQIQDDAFAEWLRNRDLEV